MERATMTVSEAADYLGVSRPIIDRLIDNGELKVLRGVSWRKITRKSIDEYLDSAA